MVPEMGVVRLGAVGVAAVCTPLPVVPVWKKTVADCATGAENKLTSRQASAATNRGLLTIDRVRLIRLLSCCRQVTKCCDNGTGRTRAICTPV